MSTDAQNSGGNKVLTFLRLRRDTHENWSKPNAIGPKNGEIILVDYEDETSGNTFLKIKIGSTYAGTNTLIPYEELPFEGDTVYNTLDILANRVVSVEKQVAALSLNNLNFTTISVKNSAQINCPYNHEPYCAPCSVSYYTKTPIKYIQSVASDVDYIPRNLPEEEIDLEQQIQYKIQYNTLNDGKTRVTVTATRIGIPTEYATSTLIVAQINNIKAGKYYLGKTNKAGGGAKWGVRLRLSDGSVVSTKVNYSTTSKLVEVTNDNPKNGDIRIFIGHQGIVNEGDSVTFYIEFYEENSSAIVIDEYEIPDSVWNIIYAEHGTYPTYVLNFETNIVRFNGSSVVPKDVYIGQYMGPIPFIDTKINKLSTFLQIVDSQKNMPTTIADNLPSWSCMFVKRRSL